MQERFIISPYKKVYYFIMLLVIAVPLITFCFCPAIPQLLDYHNFADQRTYYNIPYFYNVISNLGFLIVGVMGLIFLNVSSMHGFKDAKEKRMYKLFFLALILGSYGSAYYHWNPNNLSLFWDRLPVAIALMIFQAAIISDHISSQLGHKMLVPLMLMGTASVIYWEYTEMNLRGDLRFYGLVYLLPSLIIPIMLWKLPSRYTHTCYLWGAVAYMSLARAAEFLDHQIYALSGNLISGHTVKHLSLAAASFAILQHLRKREPIRYTSDF